MSLEPSGLDRAPQVQTPASARPGERAEARADESPEGRLRRQLAMLLRRASRRGPERVWHWLDAAPLRPLAPFVAPVLRKLERTRRERAWAW